MRASEFYESAVDDLKNRLPNLRKTDYSSIDNLMRRISRRYKITGKKLHDLFVRKYGESPDHWIKKYKEKIGETSDTNNVTYYIYGNGQPLSKYNNIENAKRDLDNIRKKIPNAYFEIKQETCNTKDMDSSVEESNIVYLNRARRKKTKRMDFGRIPPTNQPNVTQRTGNVIPIITTPEDMPKGLANVLKRWYDSTVKDDEDGINLALWDLYKLGYKTDWSDDDDPFSLRGVENIKTGKKIFIDINQLKEAANPAQQAAIAIAMKKTGKKPKNVKEEIETSSDVEKVKDFIKWTIKTLNLKKPLPKIILSKDTEEAQDGHHTGLHTNEGGKDIIWVYIGNRNLIDIFRTIFHELVHQKQDQLNMIDQGDSYPGSPIEAMADMLAGKYIKIYGKEHPEIFQ